MRVDVVIPWRSGCPHRTRAHGHITKLYADRFPHWTVTTYSLDADEPWIKARAVNRGVDLSTADIIVVADADVWCDDLADAVAAVGDGYEWSIPHLRVHRLTERATTELYIGRNHASYTDRDDTLEKPYTGVIGGGIVVARRQALVDAPLDPRFEGWGGEDTAWGYALTTIHGAPWRGKAPLWHLYHPPQPRRSRHEGSPANERLRRRYRRALGDGPAMRTLLEEAMSCR